MRPFAALTQPDFLPQPLAQEDGDFRCEAVGQADQIARRSGEGTPLDLRIVLIDQAYVHAETLAQLFDTPPDHAASLEHSGHTVDVDLRLSRNALTPFFDTTSSVRT